MPPINQQLFNKDNTLMDDDKALQDYGLNSSVAKAQCPASVGLAVRYVLCFIVFNNTCISILDVTIKR